VNTIRRSGGGEWLVTMPHVGVLPNTLFVSALSSAARICNLNTGWATTLGPGTVTVRDVVCYRVTGPMTPTQWFLSYTS
jgi:hypothetical protein